MSSYRKTMYAHGTTASLLLIIVMISCTGSREEGAVSFASLSEEQKRLPENALSSMTAADGLEVQLFASEPMVTNPTNISVDHKGRVWVCEAHNYDVDPANADEKGDRIIVLEDTDHNGVADKRTVFYQGTDINTPLGIFVSGDRVYVSRSPNVFVLADTTGDLVADKKEILFTNLGNKGDHSAHAILPGPEGKLYFATGNYAGEISDRNGDPIRDRAGFVVNQKGQPYLGGMVMRFDTDGSSFEVLGHNFRNNYEPCVDSFGNIWQSDNDDDGNESCRINYVMPYGNYGFLDEMTRASWTASRVGMEGSIPERHWHQGDPGVVPNVLITGAGSPAGMALYEGNMLPEKMRGMPVHAEPYYNVVRAYVTEPDGAGYKASVFDLLKSSDQWFRPVDVATAPDGSLFVADWYDPILGGGAAGDAVKGRIYRIGADAGSYDVPEVRFDRISENIAALSNPEPGTRCAAFHNLLLRGDGGISALEAIWRGEEVVMRARAFWILARLEREDILKEALADNDPRIRAAAIRFVLQFRDDVVPYLKNFVRDPDPHVRREAVTALRYNHTPGGADLWTEFATLHDGKDRWYLEALGIASDLHADLYFTAWEKKNAFDVQNKTHQDIAWRVRSPQTLPMLRQLIANSPDVESATRYFRAFDFHDDAKKNDVLMSLLDDEGNDVSMITMALRQMNPANLRRTAAWDRALKSALAETDGTLAFVDLVSRFDLRTQRSSLIKMAIEDKEGKAASAAIDQLIRFGAFADIRTVLLRGDSSSYALLSNLRSKGNRDIVNMIADVVSDKSKSIGLRKDAVVALGSSWPGEEKLLELVKSPEFASALKPIASGVLFNVYRSSIRREAAKYLDSPASRGANLPPVKELVASSGNAANGRIVFEKLCTSCHHDGSKGVKFGPELSLIGSKLSAEGLYQAILFPDEGISHGYAASLVTFRDGTRALGIISSETDKDIDLSLPGGVVNHYEKSQIASVEPSESSIMPALGPAMEKQELVDLITYLRSLK